VSAPVGWVTAAVVAAEAEVEAGVGARAGVGAVPAAESASGGRITAESDPFGVADGVASRPTAHALDANPSATMPIEKRFIRTEYCNVRTALSRRSRYESKRAIASG